MLSAGLLPYRWNGGLEVLAAHPGGPLWARKDRGAWSLVKGLVEAGEDPLAAAAREFTEETGWRAPPPPWIDLGEVRLRAGKRVTAWAFQGDFDPAVLEPGEIAMWWRGRSLTFPEIDRVAWFDSTEARARLNPAYGTLLDRLERKLAECG